MTGNQTLEPVSMVLWFSLAAWRQEQRKRSLSDLCVGIRAEKAKTRRQRNQWQQSHSICDYLCLRVLLKHPCPELPLFCAFSSDLCVFHVSSSLDSKIGKPANPLCTMGPRLRGEKVGEVEVSVPEMFSQPGDPRNKQRQIPSFCGHQGGCSY